MSRTEDVSRALNAVLTCGPSARASVRRDISGCASTGQSPVRFSTCAACHGCTGINSRPASRSSSGHIPVSRHSSAPTGTDPRSTTGRCSGPYASCSTTENPGRERQLGWNGCPSTIRCSHSQSRVGHSFEGGWLARDSASEATLCPSSAAKAVPCGTARSVISRAGSSWATSSRWTTATYASVAYGSAGGPSSRLPSQSRRTGPGARPTIHGSGSWTSARHSRVSTAARAPGSSAAYRCRRSGRTTESSSATSASGCGGRSTLTPRVRTGRPGR